MIKAWICSLLVACGFLAARAFSQDQLADLPVLRANSNILDVQDGNRLRKGDWLADPSVPVDVYIASRSAEPKTVTFISDIESKSFELKTGDVVDFVILLNGVDRCRTRISMRAATARRDPGAPVGPTVIPITLDGGKLHIEGRLNDSEPLDLLFDTGASTIVLYPSGQAKGASLAFDGSVANAGTGGTTIRQTSSDNRLRVGGLSWEHESVLFIEAQADDADGIVGYNVFEDKIVELDYDRMVLVVHDSLPEHATSFTKVAMPNIGSFTVVDGSLVNDSVRATGPMVIDTGGNGTLFVNRPFADMNGLRNGLSVLGSSTSRGVGPVPIRNEVVRVPVLEIAGFALADVPVNIPDDERGQHVVAIAADSPRGLLCMEVLSRFNTLFDYRRGEAYFRPNSRFVGPFTDRTSRFPLAALIGIAVVGMCGAVFVARRRLRTSSTLDARPTAHA